MEMDCGRTVTFHFLKNVAQRAIVVTTIVFNVKTYSRYKVGLLIDHLSRISSTSIAEPPVLEKLNKAIDSNKLSIVDTNNKIRCKRKKVVHVAKKY